MAGLGLAYFIMKERDQGWASRLGRATHGEAEQWLGRARKAILNSKLRARVGGAGRGAVSSGQVRRGTVWHGMAGKVIRKLFPGGVGGGMLGHGETLLGGVRLGDARFGMTRRGL